MTFIQFVHSYQFSVWIDTFKTHIYPNVFKKHVFVFGPWSLSSYNVEVDLSVGTHDYDFARYFLLSGKCIFLTRFFHCGGYVEARVKKLQLSGPEVIRRDVALPIGR